MQLRDALLGTGAGALLVAEYVTDATLTPLQLVGGIGFSLAVGVLVAMRRTLSLWLVVLVAVIFAARFLVPQGNDGIVWAVVAAIAAYSVAAESSAATAFVGLGISLLSATIAMAYDGQVTDISSALFYGGWFGAPWLAGRAVRRWRDRESEAVSAVRRSLADRDRSMREAVAEERTRIARELHDVVGHALSVMVIQADGAKRVVDADPKQAKEAMETIEETGRQALAEMRRLVRLIRDTEEEDLEPQPSLTRLHDLVEDFGKAGLPVRVHVVGEPVPLPPAVDLSAYRIVQESLTNVLRHSGADEATLEVSYGNEALRLCVTDPGTSTPVRRTIGVGDGHGLQGVRERVAVFGGTVCAGPRRQGGFEVSVQLPYAGPT